MYDFWNNVIGEFFIRLHTKTEVKSSLGFMKSLIFKEYNVLPNYQ